mmetsp:Transcript_23234/g.75130  ORF Transcript_23234/g.75130 Transcript_23234/m.75130 type:complete len:174 (+) Transcript_23234:246-767(+)
MFEEASLADVEVVCKVGAGCGFRAHRLILAARSPVFKAMFTTSMREKRLGKVEIDDVSPEAIKCMLDFVYKDECPNLSEERHVVKHFDGMPYRSCCYMCVREVASMSKQMLGEMLFPMVQKVCPEHANKITGMIIELDHSELVPLFETESSLREKVDEATLVLRAAEDSASPD